MWENTLDLMAPYAERGVEAGCFWYGMRGIEADFAVLCGIPQQINRAQNFDIPSDDLATLVSALPTEGLVTVAQIHTHPGRETTHSRWDDGLIVSRKIYSLVLPHYGKRPCVPNAVSVHEFRGAEWHSLASKEAAISIRVISEILDTRS